MSGQGPREVEIKRLLSGPACLDRLLAALDGKVSRRWRQVNHVFDTPDRRLARARHAVRLREQQGSALLTAKGPTTTLGGAASRSEAEAAVDPSKVPDLLAGRLDPVAELRSCVGASGFDELWRGLEQARAGAGLRSLGSFQNDRTEVEVALPGGKTLTVDLDRTRFPDGRTDEEVEIEVPDERSAAEAERWLEGVLGRAGIASRPATPKVARFLDALPGAPP